MNIFKYRLAGYLVLGLGLALALPPWFSPDSKKEFLTRPRVFLSALALDRPAQDAACKGRIRELAPEEIGRYPDLVQALNKLADPAHSDIGVRLNSPDPKALARELDREEASKVCFRLQGETYLLEPRPQGSVFQSSFYKIGTGSQTPFAQQALPPRELEQYPYLKAYLDGLARQVAGYEARNREIGELSQRLRETKDKEPASELDKARGTFEEIELKHRIRMRRLEGYRDRLQEAPYYEEVLSPSPVEEWKPLLDRLGLSTGSAWVRTPNYAVHLSVREYSEDVVTRLSLLSLSRKIGGVLVLLGGLLLLRRSYIKVPGIRVNPAWAAVFADTMFGLGMGVLSLGPLDYILENWFGLLPLLDGALLFTFSVMYLPCLFFLAWMASNMAGQSLEVGPEGAAWHGPGPSRFMAWEKISGLDLRQSYVMVGRAGFLMPRRLQTKLVFLLGPEDRQELFEPGTRSRKEAVLRALAEHAPDRLREDLNRVAEGWL